MRSSSTISASAITSHDMTFSTMKTTNTVVDADDIDTPLHTHQQVSCIQIRPYVCINTHIYTYVHIKIYM